MEQLELYRSDIQIEARARLCALLSAPRDEPDSHWPYKPLWFSIEAASPNRTFSMMQIKEAVCSHFGLTLNAMHTARRTKDIVRPRQIAIWLSRDLTPHSLPAIGRQFGKRDHTTILSACRRITALMLTDPKISPAIAAIRSDLEALL